MTKQEAIDELNKVRKSVTITHREELVRQALDGVEFNSDGKSGLVLVPESWNFDHIDKVGTLDMGIPDVLVAPPGRIVWTPSLDARVRPEHNAQLEVYSLAFRDVLEPPEPLPGYYRCAMPERMDQRPLFAERDNRQYRVYQRRFGSKVKHLTKFYLDGRFVGGKWSKRRKLAIAKGEAWLNN